MRLSHSQLVEKGTQKGEMWWWDEQCADDDFTVIFSRSFSFFCPHMFFFLFFCVISCAPHPVCSSGLKNKAHQKQLNSNSCCSNPLFLYVHYTTNLTAKRLHGDSKRTFLCSRGLSSEYHPFSSRAMTISRLLLCLPRAVSEVHLSAARDFVI